eukprot:2370997-Lingulodinium_polyedra.AAC.1
MVLRRGRNANELAVGARQELRARRPRAAAASDVQRPDTSHIAVPRDIHRGTRERLLDRLPE